MLELGSHRLCFLLQNRRNVPFVFPRGFGSSYCSQIFYLGCCFIGGAERDRTADLLVANEALSQLSYSPTPQIGASRISAPAPSTTSVSLAGVCSHFQTLITRSHAAAV